MPLARRHCDASDGTDTGTGKSAFVASYARSPIVAESTPPPPDFPSPLASKTRSLAYVARKR